MEQETKPITFGKFIRVAFGNWIRLAIAVAAVGIAGTLAIQLGYNSASAKYTSTFSYNKSDLNQGIYADGTSFFYTEAFSKSNLTQVAKGNEKYSSIDVEKIFDSNDISYSRAFDEELPIYTLNISKKYFSSYSQAQDFFEDVINYPINRDKELMNKEHFESNLIAFDNASTFESQIDFLKGHADSLVQSCTAIIENEKTGAGAKASAQSIVSSVKSIAGENYENITNLVFIVNQNGFVKDYECEEAKNYENKKVALQNEKLLNEQKIAALETEINNMNPQVVLNTIDETIALLTQRNVDIAKEIEVIDLKISKKSDKSEAYLAAKDAFAATLVYNRNLLSACTEMYTESLAAQYNKDGGVAYAALSVITTKSSVALPVAIILSIVAGVIVGCAVNLIVDRKKFDE